MSANRKETENSMVYTSTEIPLLTSTTFVTANAQHFLFLERIFKKISYIDFGFKIIIL